MLRMWETEAVTDTRNEKAEGGPDEGQDGITGKEAGSEGAE